MEATYGEGRGDAQTGNELREPIRLITPHKRFVLDDDIKFDRLQAHLVGRNL
jgi:hypothetical protein